MRDEREKAEKTKKKDPILVNKEKLVRVKSNEEAKRDFKRFIT